MKKTILFLGLLLFAISASAGGIKNDDQGLNLACDGCVGASDIAASGVGTSELADGTVALVDLNTTDVDTRYLTTGTAQTVTSKTFNVASNVLQFTRKDEWHNADFIQFSTNAWYTAVSTNPFYGRSTFRESASTAANIAYLQFFSGDDWDTSVTPTCYFQDFTETVDTSSRSYIVGISSVTTGQSLIQAPTQTNLTRVPINFVVTGSSGSANLSASVTLTGWGSVLAASKHYLISIAREGDQTGVDPSTTTSYFGNFVFNYGVTQ